MQEEQLELATRNEPMVNSCETEKYKPTNQEALREYDIRIRFLHRGCIVSVGCKEIAFEDHIKAMEAVNAYVANPWEEQQKWRKILR